MENNSFFIEKVLPWVFGIMILVLMPYLYLRMTGKQLQDLFVTNEITISDGNVVLKYSNGREDLLVNKDNFKDQDIKRFSFVATSPNGKYLCFLGHTDEYIWGFWSKIDGSNVEKYAIAENCAWSNSSEIISYTNHTIDISQHDVFTYNTQNKEIINYTTTGNEDNRRVYEAPRWSQDDKFLYSKYTQYNNENGLKNKEGSVIINIENQTLEET